MIAGAAGKGFAQPASQHGPFFDDRPRTTRASRSIRVRSTVRAIGQQPADVRGGWVSRRCEAAWRPLATQQAEKRPWLRLARIEAVTEWVPKRGFAAFNPFNPSATGQRDAGPAVAIGNDQARGEMRKTLAVALVALAAIVATLSP